MATHNLTTSASVNGTSAEMNLDVWRLILDQIDDRTDLCNVCLTSRAWFAMAMPHLYRVVPLRMRSYDLDYESESDLMVFAHSLSSRLLDTKNEAWRNAVHELDFGRFRGEHLIEMEKRLVALVDSLPNLQRVKIDSALTQEVLRHLTEHSKGILLYLFAEDGQRHIEPGCNFQNIVTLAAQVNPFVAKNEPNRNILGAQKLLFACPSLTTFHLNIVGGYGGCVVRLPRFESVYSFRFSGNETFPPLTRLGLSGYWLSADELEHWQQKFQWSKLKSLALGPRSTSDFLKLAEGYATSLQYLEVLVYTDADRCIHCYPLRKFLKSFTSLETLIVKGYQMPVGLVGNHPGLKRLCLHTFERVSGESRLTLSVEDLQELDKSCAHLETLELDLCRDGEWPEQILKTLATGFINVRRLTLHLEIGLRDADGREVGTPGPDEYVRIEPILNEDSAREWDGGSSSCDRRRT
ncbi:hypothetical protein O1611_g5343 [Lasiodiplodia mahajangana]|uniref:Uncharacterized protein n=1 Tax=Lasiodiplodia mahajangana TaxID=1108764 RepID=A0ACC2JM00_9PEZI|nr:hypothetical protein O1611_g5343 [Lasiodiplodia mahajangana]